MLCPTCNQEMGTHVNIATLVIQWVFACAPCGEIVVRYDYKPATTEFITLKFIIQESGAKEKGP